MFEAIGLCRCDKVIFDFFTCYSIKLISSSSFHRLDMTLAVAEALNPNEPMLFNLKTKIKFPYFGPRSKTFIFYVFFSDIEGVYPSFWAAENFQRILVRAADMPVFEWLIFDCLKH